MAIYLNTATNEYPRHDGDLELLGWAVGEALPENWVEVQYVDPPIVGDFEIPYEIAPEFIQGIWQMVWNVREMTDAEKEFKLAASCEEQ